MSKLFFLAAVFAVALIQPSPAIAQGSPPPGAGDRNMKDESDALKGRSNELERVRRDATKREDSPAPSFPQIKEDFERIQVINSDILQANAPGAEPDYKLVSEGAAELKKRATRLRTNLFPSDSKDRPKVKDTEEPQDFKSLLAELDGAISSFVHSPIFQNTKVADQRDSAQAEHDLERVIKLSTNLVKEADEMKKAGNSRAKP